MNLSEKPFLSDEELVAKLQLKGVTFDRDYSPDQAKDYLKCNNNYYKLASYRKNFRKDSNGQYIGLDFSTLVDLSVVDMLFRYEIIKMALDIEHFEKVALLRFLKIKGDDGYQTLQDYRSSLSSTADLRCTEEIDRNKHSIYCKDILSHMASGQRMPVWVFIEVVPFGQFRSFFEFCAHKYNDKTLIDESYRLKQIKSIRNAAGHNNCILNDLSLPVSCKANTTKNLNKKILNKLLAVLPCGKRTLHQKEPDLIQNDRIKEIITLLYMHSRILPSDSMKQHYKAELETLTDRMQKHIDYYSTSPQISDVFIIVDTLVKNWY